MTPLAYIHPREQIAMMMSWIYRHHLTTAAGGNISCLDENGDMWITPAAVDKGSLSPRDIVCVHADGTHEGRYAPSSEYPLHRAIYDSRPDIKGIVHAHPQSGMAFSVAKRAPIARLFPQSFRYNREVGFAPYAKPGSEKLGMLVGEKFVAGYHSVILESHGVCCGGSSLLEAFVRFDTLEFSCHAEIYASSIGIPYKLTDEQLLLARTRTRGFFGVLAPTNKPRSPQIAQAAETLCTYLRRGVEHGLFTSSLGAISLRLGPDAFLITAHGVDRSHIRPHDFVLIKGDCVEAGRTPSRMAYIHHQIYKGRPEVQAIINAAPLNCLAYSICHRAIETRAIPESYQQLRDVNIVPFETPFKKPEAILEKLSLDNPALEICNNGVMTVGADLTHAYRTLEVLEGTAAALISSVPLGGFVPMSPSAIEELAEDPEAAE